MQSCKQPFIEWADKKELGTIKLLELIYTDYCTVHYEIYTPNFLYTLYIKQAQDDNKNRLFHVLVFRNVLYAGKESSLPIL